MTKASDYFQGKEKYNCLQAIAKYFQKDYPITDEQIISYKKMGGGRVKNGICGALYAALDLPLSVEAKEALNTYFITHAGSANCKEIRKRKQTSCIECVDIAAEAVNTCSKSSKNKSTE